MIDQLNMWPLYNGHRDIHAAARDLGTVTLDREYEFDACVPRRTIYHEIMAHRDASPCDDLLLRKTEQIQAPLSEIAREGLTALREAIDAIPSGTYLMPFSGGYDSRLILALIPERIKLARITWEPERKRAAQVAELVADVFGREFFAWEEFGRGGTLDEPPQADYWRSALLPIADHGRRISDPWRWQGGRHFLPATVPGVDGVISALWADETMGFALGLQDETLGDWASVKCMDQHLPPIGRSGWWTPFVSRPWLERVALRYHLTEREPNTDPIRIYEWFGPGDSLKREMLRQINPRLLDVVNPRFELAKRQRPPFNEILPHNRLSQAAREAMHAEAMEAGWDIDIGEHVGQVPWLREYATAAIVSADRRDGVEVVE